MLQILTSIHLGEIPVQATVGVQTQLSYDLTLIRYLAWARYVSSFLDLRRITCKW